MKVCPVCHREFSSGVTHCSDDGVPLVALSTDADMRPEDLVGRIVEGRYKIERIIGKGGMGTVYACRHVVVGKIAAMKVLKAGGERTDGVLQRFVREAQTANLLRSRHIVEVSDFGQLPNGAFFVVMELLEGRDLAHAMRQGLQRPQLQHIFVQIAETLQIAHEKGIVHRDLKPDNVFLVQEAEDPHFVKLLDFGIAKILHGEPSGGLTETGVILGTPYYMSPEQARAEAIDHRSDIYSLGVMMYRAFTGRLPFLADSTMGVLTRHITEIPEAPSKLTTIDGVTERMILRCMEKRPDNRFQSMREVAETLRTLPTGPVSALREQTTVYEGPVPGAAHPTGGGYAVATGAQQASGAYAPAQPSGAYAQAQPSGAYAPAQPSGAYAPAQQSGAYAPAQQSGAYAPAQQSGAYPPAQQSGAYPPAQQSGAYPPAQQSGAYPPAQQSGAYASPTGPHGAPQLYDPRISSAPSGGYAAVPAIVGVVPRGPVAGETSTSLHMPHDGALASGETSRGLAATGATRAPRGASTATLVFGAIAMAGLGALGAFVLYRTQFSATAAGGPSASATASAAAPPTAAPAAVTASSAVATPGPTSTATAAPAVTATEPATATTAPTLGPRPHGGGSGKVLPTPPRLGDRQAAPSHRYPEPVRLMRLPVVLVTCAATLLASAVATESFAQPKKVPAKVDNKIAEAKKLFDDGAAAYAKGAYEEAIAAWEKAFELSQKPLIYESIANAWERLGDARKARDNLTKWRDSAPPEEKDLLDARIKNLDARVVREDEAARKAAEEQAARDQVRAETATSNARPWLPGAILVGAGGALAVVGVALDVVASGKRPPAGSCKAAGAETYCLASAKDAVGSSNKLAVAGDALRVVGAAAAAGGVVLIIVRRPAPQKDAAPAPPSPTAYVAPTAGGLLFGGTF